MNRFILVFAGLIMLVLTGCSEQLLGNEHKEKGLHAQAFTDPSELLEDNPNADLIRLKNIIYDRDVEWIQTADLEKGKLIGEIQGVYQRNDELKNFMATILPVGTKLYTSSEDHIIIALLDGKEIRYIANIQN
ncbi:hypothetical protein [Thalassobacillus sp. CUG 92003]|uniref:hypothetical protein n=1 Tax=Thalassobacillus sp. CUG 92003 TaxID=2736641 RepID=UPI0015E6F647|nr:hypothetical protein [Thalassobacillus sp. CUG 92003]